MLLVLDLIGFGAVLAAVAYGLWLRSSLHKIKQIDE
jgi:hypothetical protein